MSSPFTRRHTLITVAVSGSGLVMPRWLLAQETNSLIAGSDVCLLTPEVTEGPYYLDENLVRRDITEGRPGVSMTLRMQVVDATCTPVEAARVDVWHCDAQGVYSSFGGASGPAAEGETFLRGTQMADATGIAEFATIYPGWYSGRTPHIHFKVFLDETDMLTGQMFFPDALSTFLYENVPAYRRDAPRDTLNDEDGIAAQATHASYAAIAEGEAEYLAQLIVGIDPDAVSESG